MKSYETNKYNIGDKVFYVKESNNGYDIGIRKDTIQFIDFYEDGAVVYTLSEGIRKSASKLCKTYDEAYEKGEFK